MFEFRINFRIIAGSLESATWFTGGIVEVFLRGGGEKNQDFMLIRLWMPQIWLAVVGTPDHG